ncbi:MAG: hypothetical protein OSJ28_10890 [Desulfovibrio sp.]|nr:hypothetical protein [Desulfovibrio sp.]
MSANFDFAHNFTASREGGISDHPDDPGGVTAYGASCEFVAGLARNDSDFLRSIGVAPLPVCRATILAITPAQVRAMFAREFWLKPGLDDLARPIAALIYDAAVNCGLSRGIKLAQQGANRARAANLAVDGILGPKSKQALSSPDAPLIRAIAGCRRDFYRSLVRKKPSWQVFLRGWLNRIDALEALVLPLAC